MSKRKTVFLSGYYYHVFNRGTNRTAIFRNPDNYDYLTRLIKKNVTEFNISVIAYCLIPNHYHFIMRQNSDCPISECIQSIFNAYTKAFNKMFNRTGTLFESRFKSIQINSNEHLIRLCRYIHRNPIDADPPLVDQIEKWPYSNYPEWLGLRSGTLVDRGFIKIMFENSADYVEFVSESPSLKAQQRLDKYLF